MTLQQALEKIYSLHQFNIKLGLENITNFMEYVGNPQNKFKSIHIAGSNGKGSTASFIASILQEEGYKVGLYTSPHFVRFNERVKINGKEIEDKRIAEFVRDNNSYIDENSPTFFEITTALAFKYFSEMNVDYAVIETGLGGRLDATNVIAPEASVITTISLEHTNILGDTIEEVAGEKAGIIKNGNPVFCGDMPVEALNVIKKKCEETNSEMICLNDRISSLNDYLQIQTSNQTFNLYETPLRGKYQLKNAALSILILDKLKIIDNKKSYLSGIKNVVRNTGISGRYEMFNEEPPVILDSAHNKQSIEEFLKNYLKTKSKDTKYSVLYGCMKDKDYKSILKILNDSFDKIFLTTFDYERAATLELLENAAEELKIRTISVDDVQKFVKDFIKSGADQELVVLGSMFIVGKIKELDKIT